MPKKQPAVADCPADLGDVLLDELKAVRSRRRQFTAEAKATASAADPLPNPDASRTSEAKLADYYDQIHKLGDLSALCLSGGGVRSAAFALGVIQGLAARGLLPRFDYLSTVSGGGYIGGCLTAWVQRRGYEHVCNELSGAIWPPPQISPLQHLRRYSNFLTPHKGLLTADSLTLVALYVRNLFLNWLILLPLIVLAVVAIKLAGAGAWAMPAEIMFGGASIELPAVLAALAIVLIGWAFADSLRQRPGWESTPSNPRKFQWQEVLPLLVGGMLVSVAVLKYPELTEASRAAHSSPFVAMIRVSLIGGAMALIGWMIAFYFSKPHRTSGATSTEQTVRSATRPYVALAAAGFTLAGALSGLVLGAAAFLVTQVADNDLRALLVVCFGPPTVVAALFVGELMYIGMTSYVPWGEGEREWLARSAGHHGRAAVVWTAASLLVLLGSVVLFEWERMRGALPSLASLGAVAGAVIAFLGKAPTTAATIKQHYKSLQGISTNLVLAIATPLFVVIMVSLLSYAIDHLANNHRALSFSQVKGAAESLWLWLGGTAAAALVIGALASIAINTNRFSLHGMYRNRLIRAFLGASNDQRQPNKFTDFDENDNFRLSDLWPNAPCASSIPPQLFVSNMALNVVATKELAWQERKALSFTGTARWIGSGSLHETGCYRRADQYGSAMSLGSAMTISGAAASPNMGYHSSPTLSVLLTFFNVRLGAWLGNPGPAGARTYALQGPFFAIKPLVQEAFGLTTDDREYVYLSDGGHFENLGLYEMVRRRCHLIVVSDAGCDPACAFEDLGNAVRKISIDQHVAIDFRGLTIGARRQPPVKGPYCAVADIIYPEPGARPGVLLYLKPGYQGIEPASVRSYAAANAVFPHERTSDQWFGESQFEAYRALGEYILQSLDGHGGRAYPGIKDFVDAVAAKMRPPLDPLQLQVNYQLHGRIAD